MSFATIRRGLDPAGAGSEMRAWMAPLFPWLRSITGEGTRRTLDAIGQLIPLERHEVPTGTAAFDWEVPREWHCREAWARGPDGRKVVDLADSSLHVLNYSAPFRGRVSRAELVAHVHSLPDRPGWIPYRTSYYRETWGFCMRHDAVRALPEGEYEVCIDADLVPGSLSYGEHVVAGECDEEVLLSCHICHPSLANDNLAGMAVCAFLARLLAGSRPRYTHRFLFLPGTIGAIVWLSRNRERAARIRAGLVAACLGDPGPMTYKRSRRHAAEIDRAALHVLGSSGAPFEVLDFVPFGYDERQYGSPGFDLAVGSLTRTPHGRYPEYHTSADDLDFVRPAALGDSLQRYLEVLEVLDGNRRYRNLNPHCEPQLGRRGLYRTLGGGEDGRERELALLWVLNQSDGEHALLDIAERARMPFPAVRAAADQLLAAGLLEALD